MTTIWWLWHSFIVEWITKTKPFSFMVVFMKKKCICHLVLLVLCCIHYIDFRLPKWNEYVRWGKKTRTNQPTKSTKPTGKHRLDGANAFNIRFCFCFRFRPTRRINYIRCATKTKFNKVWRTNHGKLHKKSWIQLEKSCKRIYFMRWLIEARANKKLKTAT